VSKSCEAISSWQAVRAEEDDVTRVEPLFGNLSEYQISQLWRASSVTTVTGVRLVMSLPVHTQKDLIKWGEKADASNLERGLMSLPVELTTEILDYFPTIGPYTAVYSYNDNPILPEFYLVRVDILRALSQVCIDYRRIFLPLLWESLNPCFKKRRDSSKPSSNAFYEQVGDALIRNCDALTVNPNLASYIG
jgi:hypothetical protein